MLAEKIGASGLIRLTTVTAYVVALLFATVPTTIYVALSHAELQLVVQREAIEGATLASNVAHRSSTPASLDSADIKSILQQESTHKVPAIRRLIDAGGVVVFENSGTIGYWPVSARSPVHDTHGVIGQFEVVRSVSEEFGNVIGLLIVSLWLGTWSFLVLRILPDRALKNALKAAIESREIAESAMLARDKAQEAARLRSVFLANMSHELRTPINGVLGMIDLVADTELDDEQREYVALAGTSGRHLLAIINDILDFSKLDEGKIEIVSSSFVFRELIVQVLDSFRPEATRKGLHVDVLLDESLPEMLYGDPVRIRQILVNLVSNAVEFTAVGRISLTARPIAQRDTNFVEVVVADTGIGIPENELLHIFEPFTQVDESSTRLHGGAGLGLTISRQLAVAMGGTLNVTSDVGLGSKFCLTIPLSATPLTPRT